MINIALVIFAYGIFSSISMVSAEYYYFACAASYSVIAIASGLVSKKNKSIPLFFYALVNLMGATLHFLLNFGLYDLLRGVIWHNACNFSLIVELVEMVLLFKGVTIVLVYLLNNFFIDSVKRKGNCYNMVYTK